MKPDEAYRWLMEYCKETAYYQSIRSLLAWDQRTCLPEAGRSHRAAQLGVMAGLLSKRMTNPKMGEMLARVEAVSLITDPLADAAVNVREWRRAYDRANKIPKQLAVELARAGSEGEAAWQAARPKNDWQSFLPYLERIVRLKHEEAERLGFAEELYDGLINDYEPGETATDIASVFGKLGEALIQLCNRIEASGRAPDAAVLRGSCPVAEQQAFADEVVSRIGYDFNGGRMDRSAHPFTSGIGPGDTRITTRFDESSFVMALFSAIHEAGHAMYHQGLPKEHWGTPRGRYVSMGIHESQSLGWENFVARSAGFWSFFYPLARKRFPYLDAVAPGDFLFAINEVKRSLIRTEADEVTYGLHVILRFEIELALIRGEIEPRDLPGVWNEKMKKYLGIVPPDYSSGVMQDVHWSDGAFGYFPSYVLGNLYAAQFLAKAEKDLGALDDLFVRGEFHLLVEWLKTNIYAKGFTYWPRDLVRTVTGEDLNPDHLVRYLNGKYGALYGF